MIEHTLVLSRRKMNWKFDFSPDTSDIFAAGRCCDVVVDVLPAPVVMNLVCWWCVLKQLSVLAESQIKA